MANIDAVKKYQASRDAFKIRPTAEEGQTIREYAAAHNMSVQWLFLVALREYMERHPMEYRYGMRLRGYSPGAQPDGAQKRYDDPTGRYHDIIVYNRRLSDSEIREYDLDNLN